MDANSPTLFIEINDSNYIFVAGYYDENQILKVHEKIIAPKKGISEKKFINIDDASEILKKNIDDIEIKLNCVFKTVNLILDDFEYNCINISSFKKLNGSQVLKENISYILNSLKLAISDNEEKQTILHIFNSRSFLDGTNIENLPIGLYGDFFSHELTFFLIKNNDLNNINQIFSKNNIKVKKIFLKSFNEGTQLIDQNKIETFFKININQYTSKISFFDQSSFRYSEHFNFGTNMVIKDIEKICSINKEMILEFLSHCRSEKIVFSESNLLEKKYFIKENYRKIRKKLIFDIAKARISEITDIILNKNINLNSFKQRNCKIYFTIKDEVVLDNFEEYFKSYFSRYNSIEPNLITDFNLESTIANIGKLSAFGWKKEAVPFTQVKNSLITRIFKTIFG